VKKSASEIGVSIHTEFYLVLTTGDRTLFSPDDRIKAVAKIADLQLNMNSELQWRPGILHALKVFTFPEVRTEDSMRKN
jgi:hypothetical protein